MAGVRPGDGIQGDYNDVKSRLDALKPGEEQVFTVDRYGTAAGIQKVKVEIVGARAELSNIWYADLWYPIAGALFLCCGLFLFATAYIKPTPLWRLR